MIIMKKEDDNYNNLFKYQQKDNSLGIYRYFMIF